MVDQGVVIRLFPLKADHPTSGLEIQQIIKNGCCSSFSSWMLPCLSFQNQAVKSDQPIAESLRGFDAIFPKEVEPPVEKHQSQDGGLELLVFAWNLR